jgi:hypothetical protein
MESNMRCRNESSNASDEEETYGQLYALSSQIASPNNYKL